MKRRNIIPNLAQPLLFDQVQPSVALPPALKIQLSAPLEALFLEIAGALASREASDEQDHC